MTTIAVETPEAMEALGARVGSQLRAGDLVSLTGVLGAGKTTFTRGVGAALGVRGAVTSPTFVLARTHPRPAGGPPLVHVDAYRLGGAAELDDLDIDFAQSIVVVEWGANLLDGISDSMLDIVIDRPTGRAPDPAGEAPAPAGDGVEPRQVTITASGPRWQRFPLL